MLTRCVGISSLLVSAALLAPLPSSADTSSGWTVPVKTSGVAEQATYLTASSSAIAYGGYDGVVYRTSAANDVSVLKDLAEPLLSGSSLIATHLQLRGPTQLQFFDTATGATSTVDAPPGGAVANLGGVALANACCTNPTNFVFTHGDGTKETISIPVGFVYSEAGNDANGFAFWSANAQETKYVLYYYDLATRTYREIQRGDGAIWPGRATVTPHDIVWLLSNNMAYRTPRAGGAIAQSQAPAGTTAIAATDNMTAFIANGSVVVRTAAGDMTANVPPARSITSDGTNILVSSDADVTTAGIYQINPAGQVQKVIPLRRVPYKIGGFTFSLGHVYYSDNSAAGSPWWTRAVGADTSTVVVGSEARLNVWPWSAVTSGDRIAYPQRISGLWHVRVLRNGRLERDFAVPGELPYLQMSGPRLYMSTTAQDGTAWTKLADLSTGSLTTLTVLNGGAAVWGPLLVYVDKKDQLWRRDLTKPTSDSNPQLLMTPTQNGRAIFAPNVWGDWVGWDGGLLNTRTGERLATNTRANVHLADGSATWFETTGELDDNAQWMAMRLTGSDRTHIPLGRNVANLSVVEDKFAWTDVNANLLHVDELPFNGTDVPRALYLTPKRAFTPIGKRHYVVELDSTKSLRSWAIEIRGPHGALIRRWTGSALDSGVVKVGWDGTNGIGHRVAAGTYTVKATGIAADGSGALRRAFGSKPPMSWIAVTYPR